MWSGRPAGYNEHWKFAASAYAQWAIVGPAGPGGGEPLGVWGRGFEVMLLFSRSIHTYHSHGGVHNAERLSKKGKKIEIGTSVYVHIHTYILPAVTMHKDRVRWSE